MVITVSAKNNIVYILGLKYALTATYTQCLVIYGIELVLLLLLLIFRDTLLSYSLVLIGTITAPGIPVRRNT